MTNHPWSSAYPADIDWSADIPRRPLTAILDDSAGRHPGAVCIDFFGRHTTYRELADLVACAARGFQDLGVTRGTRVGLFLPNCPQFVIAYFGILRAGGIVVNYSPLYSEPQIRHQIEDSGTEIMVTLNLAALYPLVRRLVDGGPLKRLVVGTMPEVLPTLKSLLFPIARRKEIASVRGDGAETTFAALLRNRGDPTPVEIDPATDVAVLQYTGGTTGVPKGAMLTHGGLYANTHQAKSWFAGVESGTERMMGVLPFFHVFAMTVVMCLTLYIGGRILMHPRFQLDAVLKDIHARRPTIFPGVPAMFVAANESPLLPKLDLTSIKFCISGGAPLPVEVRERFEAVSSCKLVEGYGLTEASAAAVCNPLYSENKAASVGLPLPGTTVSIRDPEPPHEPRPTGERGEIWIRGPQVMKGYWNKAEATRAVIEDGWLRTGDIGYMDEDGYTFLVDRIKDLILVSASNVYPRNVEEAIYQHEAVAEVIVIGVPDKRLGQAVKAFVRLVEGKSVTEDDLREFLSSRLGRKELPREIEFRDSLPKTMVGKLSKKELVEEEEEKYAAANKARPKSRSKTRAS